MGCLDQQHLQQLPNLLLVLLQVANRQPPLFVVKHYLALDPLYSDLVNEFVGVGVLHG